MQSAKYCGYNMLTGFVETVQPSRRRLLAGQMWKLWTRIQLYMYILNILYWVNMYVHPTKPVEQFFLQICSLLKVIFEGFYVVPVFDFPV